LSSREYALKEPLGSAKLQGSITKQNQLKNTTPTGKNMGSERERELRRRRKRKKKMNLIKERYKKASSSEKEVLVAKIRRLSPGASTLIAALGSKK